MAKEKDVEAYIEELKQITEKLEAGDLKLKDAIELYKQGTVLAAKTEKLLGQYEDEIEIIEKSDYEDQ